MVHEEVQFDTEKNLRSLVNNLDRCPALREGRFRYLTVMVRLQASSLRSRLPTASRVRRQAPSGCGSAGMKPTVRFFNHDGGYRPMGCLFESQTEAPQSGRVRARPSGRTGSSYALLIVATRPAGYSSAGCSPALPTSASPARPS
jgi:hypothetical protein